MSATEEEFNEAKDRGIPILMFVQNIELEPQQREFLNRVTGYECGKQFDKFDTPTELASKITKSIYQSIEQPSLVMLDLPSAAKHAKKTHYLNSIRRPY